MIKLYTTVDRPYAPADYPLPSIYVDAAFSGTMDGREGASPRSVSSYVLLDCSGSMAGEKLSDAKLAVSEYIKTLRTIDDLTLIAFSGNIQTILRKQQMTDAGKSTAQSLLAKVEAESETRLFAALKASLDDIKNLYVSNAWDGPSVKKEVIRVVLVTDGQPTDVDPGSKIGDYTNLAKELRKQSATLISLGIGDDYNEDLLVKLFQANEGAAPEHINDPAKLSGIFDKISAEAKKVVLPSAKLNVKLTKGVTFNGAYKIAPSVQELKSSTAPEGNLLTFEVGDIVAGEGPELCLSFALPSRPVGEFRELSFNVEGASTLSSMVTVNRTLDRELIRTRHDLSPEVKYQEAHEQSIASGVIAGELPPTKLREVITKRMSEPAKTKLMSDGHVDELRKTLALTEQGKSADQEEVKKTKSLLTKRRGQP